MTARTVALAAIAFVAGFVLGASVAAETHAHSSRRESNHTAVTIIE